MPTGPFTFNFLCMFTIFQVAGLFGDASIGNAINVVVVRLILLEQDEVKITLIKKRQHRSCLHSYHYDETCLYNGTACINAFTAAELCTVER